MLKDSMFKAKIIKTIGGLVIAICFGLIGFRFGFWQGQEDILKQPPPQITNAFPEAALLPEIPENNNNANPNEEANASGETAQQNGISITSNDFSIFWEAWRKLEQNYLKRSELDYQKMIYGAISGMVDSLDDPYTVFFTPKEATDFNEELSGHYEGVGMVVGIKDDKLKVVSPFKGTPAFMAGLLSGDEIVKVDETLTKDISIEEAVSLIKGEGGTQVKLLIQRDSFKEPKEFVLTRAVITIPTLEAEVLNDNIAYIKLYQFNRISSGEFAKEAFSILNNPKIKGIIFDLRDNPGGFLDEANRIASWFVKKGEVITWQDSGIKGKEEPYESTGPSSLAQYKTVVLINKGSASGSEILAGALRDQLQIKLIGETSFGKGSVQDQITLSNGSSLKVTIARWLTPNKISINEEGLTPDIEVKMDENTEGDIQLEKAVEILKGLM
ncbi:peptidase S41 [bacterium (Candidatus Gribaldobacteria) CG23_combo_of_CG06-09_8_20_14_all_37_87_8]|uniref:Peptidase S41 n=2 Tax=Candidatus Gribaldobacteria TaxID=2798536 RepID=A0A2G9ZEZ3_9BACT|nr:MAG: hypothetical protein AUJ25_02290 [Parcubacteria group bacterium CG1_02_37_13]PIP31734.1 MAG: peptidase S41 [bacterium (Candidatus Gribaldobacteria) CG23_combo_of_CG06-09_8_20_14_all_37_87_8]PIR90788.1 MAG: hypothetical protein COU05_00155 [bacterium (Candidatus Gribaldobacteria) CG10_big_fil_rev_8_21_14_0_10_37_21]